MALDMPLYMAPGAGLIIWILVCPVVSAGSADFGRGSERCRIPSAGRLGTSPSAPVMVSAVACSCAAWAEAYGDARERARKHVRGEGEVWRQGFIAGAVVSNPSSMV